MFRETAVLLKSHTEVRRGKLYIIVFGARSLYTELIRIASRGSHCQRHDWLVREWMNTALSPLESGCVQRRSALTAWMYDVSVVVSGDLLVN